MGSKKHCHCAEMSAGRGNRQFWLNGSASRLTCLARREMEKGRRTYVRRPACDPRRLLLTSTSLLLLRSRSGRPGAALTLLVAELLCLLAQFVGFFQELLLLGGILRDVGLRAQQQVLVD